jgi:hypothetical protein
MEQDIRTLVTQCDSAQQNGQAMNDGTLNLEDTFIFDFKPDGSLELVASGDIAADNERLARKLHRARVRGSLRVIRGGKSE